MNYNPALGIQGNLVNSMAKQRETDKQVNQNKVDTDKEMLEIQANVVEAVIDEYKAIIE